MAHERRRRDVPLTFATEARVNEHAFHLAVLGIDRPERAAPGGLLLHTGQKQTSSWRRIFARKGSKLFLERGRVKVFVNQRQILDMALSMPCNERAHEVAHRIQLQWSARLGDIDQAGARSGWQTFPSDG